MNKKRASWLALNNLKEQKKMTTMQWLNPPQSWHYDQNVLSMFVTPKTDFWRETHYGFVVDDGPFCYQTFGGAFEATVKISGQYKSRFDQMGLMLRIDHETWIKTGIEYLDDRCNISAVVTHRQSDWSMMEPDADTTTVWIRAVRLGDTVSLYYSTDNVQYIMIRMAYFPQHQPVMVGMVAASPDGDGFSATFEDFQVRHLPDPSRSKWLEAQQMDVETTG